MHQKLNPRPTIGVLTNWSDNAYESLLRRGIADAAIKYDFNLVCFIGGAINSVFEYECQQNSLYNLINKSNLDGVILCTGAIGLYISTNELEKICKNSFCGIPKVSIAIPLENVPSVLSDTKRGFKELLEHLILFHNYKRIAFICGPETNPEAVDRYIIYKETLIEHNLPVDPDLIVEGNFNLKSGQKAVKTLLDIRKADFDAIVSASDDMAFGALMEMQSRNVKIPYDIAITGFDDLEESKYFTPSLTTIRQPLYDQGMKAAEILFNLIQGKTVPEKTYLPAELIIRESCGCLPRKILKENPHKKDKIVIKAKPEKLKTLLQKNRESFLSFFKDNNTLNPPNEAEKVWIEQLYDTFYKEIVDKKEGSFLDVLNFILYNNPIKDEETAFYRQKLLAMFRDKIHPLIHNKKVLLYAENLWHKAMIMISELTHRYEAFARLQAMKYDLSMRDFAEHLITKNEMEPLLDVIEEQLPKMGINECYLCLYEEKNKLDSARLILAFNEKGRIKTDNSVFNTSSLIPLILSKTENRFALITEALFYGNDKIGFALFNMGHDNGRVYQTLRMRLSNALRGTLLFKELKAQTNNLEIEVKKRTADLLLANKELKQEIKERKKAETELKRSNQELEQFAYIASHDLQEPLRMIGSFVSLLSRRYKDKIDSNANEYIDFTLDGVKRMSEMINDLLTYSRVKSKIKEMEKINFTQKLKEAIQALQIIIEEKDAVITYDELPVLMAVGSQIRQLFQNLLSNALKFIGGKKPVIHVSVKETEEEIVFSVADNGIGMEAEYKEAIFIMFKRLHTKAEYPGTGIGLAICKKIVELHKGTIWVESTPGIGSTFHFAIPKKGDKDDGY